MKSSPPGQIITFYSYKGGTGRTMALANVACLLGQGYPAREEKRLPRVLALDWDFEAPGLHRYFSPYLKPSAKARFESTPGCLDLFAAFDEKRSEYNSSDYVANRERAISMLRKLDFDEYLVPTQIPGLHIMKAGRFDDGYARRVSEFQWDRLFRETIGLFSGFAEYLRQNYDYVLVDSRTGMSDTSGICTMLLPDKLVVVFTPNQQSLTGIGDLARKAVAYRKASPDARPLTVFPLPSRLETARPALLEAWRTGTAGKGASALPQDLIGYQPLFERLFDEIYARKGTGLSEYFDAVMLQHIPDYAYGEPIAVMLEETDSRLSLRSSYVAFAERMTDLQAPWESPAQVRLEKEIQGWCEEARAKAAAGDIDSALRLAYGLMEHKPPNTLLETVARAILDVARVAYPRARDQVAAMLRQAADRVANQNDLDPLQVADMLVEAGKLCLEAGDYRLAMNLLQQGMKRLRERLGEEHPATLRSMNNLAETLRAQGDLPGARALQEKALEARRRVLGEEHPATLTSIATWP
jgi:eukaryotic-like serine/threonine-protein kinase